jgi:hypothetical protein
LQEERKVRIRLREKIKKRMVCCDWRGPFPPPRPIAILLPGFPPGIFFPVEVSERDVGPMARFEELKADVGVPAEVFARLTDADSPMTLPELAREWRVPRGKFVDWFTTTHRAMYDSALKVLTDTMVFESIRIADAADPEGVAKAKLRIETRLRTAARWDRERYGERETPAVVLNLSLVDTAREIRLLEERLGLLPAANAALPVVVEAEPI